MSAEAAPEISFRRIVCGIDLSPQSRIAVGQAMRVGERDAELIGVAVVDPGEVINGGIHAVEIAEDLQEGAETALRRAREEFPALQTQLFRGGSVGVLIHRLQEERADLAAVGAHGSSRAAGILFGSVATALAHHGPCPVLLARDAGHEFPKTILHAADGSPESQQAANAAGGIAARNGSALVILHVGEEAEPDLAVAEEAAALVAPHGVEPEVRVVAGPPERRIVETAGEIDASLVVMGSRGRTGFRALGSVSERVAHHAGCSVLVVRRPTHIRPEG